MRNNGLNLVLLLMLVWVKLSLQYECRRYEDCECRSIPPDESVIRCLKDSASTFVIEIKSKELVKIKCNEMATWSDFKMNSTAEIEDIDTFFFEQCSLPSPNLYEIPKRMGFKPRRVLRFQSCSEPESTLERRHLTGFPELKELDLSSNGLTELPADLLTDLPELIALNLESNNVILPLHFFDSVPKLKSLELGANNLENIDPMRFRGLEELTYLTLHVNALTHFEENMFENLFALEILEIGGNSLTTLHPEIFKPLGNLSELHMSENYISSLPGDLLSKNLNLKIFVMSDNRGNLTTLPSRFFSNLPKLKKVNLANDKLEDLPEDIFWGSSFLVEIFLQRNSLSTLPMNIFKESKNLERLYLSSNKLKTLPDGIFKALSKLKKLELQNNDLISISEHLFSGLSGLTEINLEYNGLKNIGAFSFSYLRELQVARLSHNQLTLPKNQLLQSSFNTQSPFNRCDNLRELYLAYNHITTIFPDWASALRKLERLDLKYNKISSVSAHDFQFFFQNINIDITHNNISEIDLDDLEKSVTSQDRSTISNSKIVHIKIDENPILCNCRLYALLKYLKGDMHPDVRKLFDIDPGHLKCDGPEWMRHMNVSDLNYKTLMCAMPVCPEKCECWFRRDDKTTIANCSYRNLRTAPERIISSYIDGKVELSGEKVELDLTGNFFTQVPFINQSGYGHITELLLSHNNISIISPDNIPLKLEVLELHNNNLTKIDSMVLDSFINSTALKNLTLHANPWKCDCEAKDFLSFIQTSFKKIPKLLNVTCGTDIRPISKMTASDFCPVSTGIIVGVSVGLAILGLLIGISVALYYRYQTEVKVWLYAHQIFLWFVTEEELDKDKLYDAFISYSHKDEDFVLNKLVPKLEDEPRPYKLCLHFRDWWPGELIPAQIARSVEDSRRTIVILSPNFLESVWGKMEFRTAHKQALTEGRARVIVILLGDVGPTDKLDAELKAYLSMNTYVEWGDPWFWDKLRYALPHTSPVKQDNANRIFKNLQINGDKNGLIHPPGFPITPPAVTTPPADTLKTFTSNGSLNKGVLITDCIQDGMKDFNASDTNIDRLAKQRECDNNIINGETTPV